MCNYIKTCIICNTEFVTRTSRSICCSNLKCKQKRNNQVNAQYKQDWAVKNKEKTDLVKKRWLENNPEKRKQSSSEYMKRNKEYYVEYASLRKRCCKQATPKWADLQSIKDVYLEATYMQMQVDHIIPLQHPLVCGLHVWNNLQLLSKIDNCKKSNKFDDVLAIIE